MGDDLNQLRVFVEVAKQGSYSAAAKVLDMPRSTVSRWVQELEASLGVRLLQRTTRRVQLTEIGEGYYQRASQAVQSVQDAQAWVRSRVRRPKGTLRISTFQLCADTLLGPVLIDYLTQYPAMSVQVSVNERSVDLVDERIDLAIRVGTLKDSSLVARKLAQSDSWMVASPSYLAEKGVPQHPNELEHHSNLLYSHDRETMRLPFTNGGQSVHVSLPSRCVVDSIRLVRQLTRAGMGIGFLPPILVQRDVANGSLVRVLPEWTTLQMAIYAVYPSHKHLAQKVASFVDLLAVHVTNDTVCGERQT